MSTGKFSYKAALMVLLMSLIFAFACTRVEDNSRAASILVLSSVIGDAGDDGGEQGTPLLSDTCDNPSDEPQIPEYCTVFNDNAILTFMNQYLQVGSGAGFGGPSYLSNIIVNRYRVDYFRPNGRNTPGVDVPYGIDGSMNVLVAADSTAGGNIIVVRHEAKREPPLSELTLGFEGVLTANADMKFYGQDLSGRTVSTTGYLEIHFANFGESQ